MSATRDDGDDHVTCARHARPAGDTWNADAARARLADLQRSAAEAYTAIKDADDALRGLARHRVTAERVLRLAAARHAAAARAAAEHARARPGLLAQLATRFRARREWQHERPASEAALADAERQLAAARQALSAVKYDFTARLAGRAASALTLRRLTAECAAARSQVASAEGISRPGGNAAASLRGRDEDRWDNGWRA